MVDKKFEDFLKWLCGKAEGFSWEDGIITIPTGNLETIDALSTRWRLITYPFLLRKAIEGINMSHFSISEQSEVYIDIYSDCIVVNPNGPAWGLTSGGHDEQMELTLMYVKELEEK